MAHLEVDQVKLVPTESSPQRCKTFGELDGILIYGIPSIFADTTNAPFVIIEKQHIHESGLLSSQWTLVYRDYYKISTFGLIAKPAYYFNYTAWHAHCIFHNNDKDINLKNFGIIKLDWHDTMSCMIYSNYEHGTRDF